MRDFKSVLIRVAMGEELLRLRQRFRRHRDRYQEVEDEETMVGEVDAAAEEFNAIVVLAEEIGRAIITQIVRGNHDILALHQWWGLRFEVEAWLISH